MCGSGTASRGGSGCKVTSGLGMSPEIGSVSTESGWLVAGVWTGLFRIVLWRHVKEAWLEKRWLGSHIGSEWIGVACRVGQGGPDTSGVVEASRVGSARVGQFGDGLARRDGWECPGLACVG